VADLPGACIGEATRYVLSFGSLAFVLA